MHSVVRQSSWLVLPHWYSEVEESTHLHMTFLNPAYLCSYLEKRSGLYHMSLFLLVPASTFEETDKYSSTLSDLRFDQSQDCPHFHSAVTSLIVSASPQAFISKFTLRLVARRR